MTNDKIFVSFLVGCHHGKLLSNCFRPHREASAKHASYFHVHVANVDDFNVREECMCISNTFG